MRWAPHPPGQTPVSLLAAVPSPGGSVYGQIPGPQEGEPRAGFPLRIMPQTQSWRGQASLSWAGV